MLSRIAAFFVRVLERWLPDPYLLAVLLTFVTALLALVLTPTKPVALLGMWYDGLWQILDFACQTILVLVTGYTLAHAPPIRRLMVALAERVKTPRTAAVVLIVIMMLASFLNWGFGLVTGALLARELARRVRVDFPFLVAAAYSGFVIWASGFSSSIALVTALKGNALNIIEQKTGVVIPLSQTVGAPFNVVPTALLFILVPLVFSQMVPPPESSHVLDPAALDEEDGAKDIPRADTPATRLENAAVLNYALAAAGLFLVGQRIITGQFTLELHSLIFIFLMLSLIFHRTPIRLVRTFTGAARVSGPLLLQYPLYGGIMAMMTQSGLARLISQAFVGLASAHTLPFWSFCASCVISLFVPSGGGHWAVQAPIMVPAAQTLGASQAAIAMAVAFGEQVANMVQPFWALPILAIAGLGVRDIMGYCVITLVISFIAYGAALLLLV